MDILNSKTDELLEVYSLIIEELIRRGVIRTTNNPVADYAEYIVAKKLGLKLENNSTAGHDAIDENNIKYQIKSRRNNDRNKSKQLGVIRNLELKKFDYLIGVIFNDKFHVLEAYKIPVGAISDYARFSPHQNGHILALKGKVLRDERIEDISSKIR